MRDGLVVAQVAIACTLLVAVGLAGSAFSALVARDPGFRADGVLTAAIELPAGAYPGADGAAFYRSLVERLGALPGVERAGAVEFLPLSGVGWSGSFELIDPDPAVTDPDPGSNIRAVAPGYFETLGIPVLEGRTFVDADDGTGPPVAVIDATLARTYWPNGSAVGRQAYFGALSRQPTTIIGVVGTVPDESLASPGAGTMYFSVLQRSMRAMTLTVRTGGDPAALAPGVRAAIREADPRIPVTELSTLSARLRGSVADARAGLLLLGAFGAVAMLLAAVGIYVPATGVVSRLELEHLLLVWRASEHHGRRPGAVGPVDVGGEGDAVAHRDGDVALDHDLEGGGGHGRLLETGGRPRALPGAVALPDEGHALSRNLDDAHPARRVGPHGEVATGQPALEAGQVRHARRPGPGRAHADHERHGSPSAQRHGKRLRAPYRAIVGSEHLAEECGRILIEPRGRRASRTSTSPDAPPRGNGA